MFVLNAILIMAVMFYAIGEGRMDLADRDPR
jgi:hypothetical protein